MGRILIGLWRWGQGRDRAGKLGCEEGMDGKQPWVREDVAGRMDSRGLLSSPDHAKTSEYTSEDGWIRTRFKKTKIIFLNAQIYASLNGSLPESVPVSHLLWG